MTDYKIQDTVNSNSQSQSSNQQVQSVKSNTENSNIEDHKQSQQGTVATEQQLPQTGVNSYVPQVVFGCSFVLLLMAIAFKLGTLYSRDDA